MTAIVSNPATTPHVIAWPLLTDDFVLPDDPVENEAQPRLASALTSALVSQPDLMKKALIVSNFALCASVDAQTICKAPDWMYIAPVEPVNRIRRSYTPHREGAVPPLVMEFLSESDCGEYSIRSSNGLGKWYFYERIIKIPTYVIFDPASGELEVFDLKNGAYVRQEADSNGRCFMEALNLRIGVWQGTREFYEGFWLRWWTDQGDMLLWPEEQAQVAQAQAAQAQAQAQAAVDRATKAEAEHAALLAKLKAAGLD